jgi:hypothetical protein
VGVASVEWTAVRTLECDRARQFAEAFAQTEKDHVDLSWLVVQAEKDARWDLETDMFRDANRVYDMLLWRVVNEECTARFRLESHEQHATVDLDAAFIALESALGAELAAVRELALRRSMMESADTLQLDVMSPQGMSPHPLMSLHSPQRVVVTLAKSDESLVTPQSSAHMYASTDQPVTDPSRSLDWAIVSRSTETVARENSEITQDSSTFYPSPSANVQPQQPQLQPNPDETVANPSVASLSVETSPVPNVLSTQQLQSMWTDLDTLRAGLSLV